jgi:thiosulfate/3-mercaptopyruvate sulfurtransferase
VLDIRDPESYSNGHIPGAVNVPENEWYVNDPIEMTDPSIPWMELPKKNCLFDLIGNAGITSDSCVVVVGSTSGPLSPIPFALYNAAGITRVAITLLYAGIRNVAVLDGGFEKWEDDIESGTTTTPTPVRYREKECKTMFVSMQYVAKKIGKSVIVDARDEIVYNGTVREPWCAYGGHIPTAVNLPTPYFWNIKINSDGNAVYITYKRPRVLERMVSSIVGLNKDREIIVYCGVGGYASTAYFVLSEVLGYRNVKFYDGSAQEWTYSGMPTVCT